MTNKKQVGHNIFTISLLLIFILSIGFALSATVVPSRPTSITGNYTANFTNSYPNGSMLNGTRGYIYNLTITEHQPSQKWVGYVGNIQGSVALQNAVGKALYNWSLTTVKGELYATKETQRPAGVSAFDQTEPGNGGMPNWTSVICANATMIDRENDKWNHGAADEDRYEVTFKTAFNHQNFYVGEKQVTDSAKGSGNCYGIHLNNGTSQTSSWREVVLTDDTYQEYNDTDETRNYDLLYTVLLENDSVGFDGNTYDFQILLPQTGLNGSQPRQAFYFFIELV